MGKAVLTFGIVVLGIAMLLLASCVNEQVARPLPNGTDTSASAAQQVPSPADRQDSDAVVPAPVKTNKTAAPAPSNDTLAGTQAANATAANAAASSTSATAKTFLAQGCIDTDAGKDHMIKGTVQYNAANVSLLKTDECVGTDLREWYCETNGDLGKAIIVCSKGCQDGRCVG